MQVSSATRRCSPNVLSSYLSLIKIVFPRLDILRLNWCRPPRPLGAFPLYRFGGYFPSGLASVKFLQAVPGRHGNAVPRSWPSVAWVIRDATACPSARGLP
jgi:hypothetical protein